MKSGRGRSQKSLDIIQFAVDWFAENHPAGVRACCYKLFVAGLIKDMSKNSTNGAGRLLKEAREEGILPWEHITDETRSPERPGTWRNPDQIIRAAVNSYRRNYWQDQPEKVEVWSEKGTIRGTLAPVLDKYGVTFRVMHGFASATVIHEIAEETINDEKRLTVFYVGDWDPSGMHMSEVDLPERLRRYGGRANIRRIALAPDDINGNALPSFEADTKKGDTRYEWFVSTYGSKCWELDAMSPVSLRERVGDAIRSHLDVDAWNHAIEIEAAETKSMAGFLATWNSNLRQASKYQEGAK